MHVVHEYVYMKCMHTNVLLPIGSNAMVHENGIVPCVFLFHVFVVATFASCVFLCFSTCFVMIELKICAATIQIFPDLTNFAKSYSMQIVEEGVMAASLRALALPESYRNVEWEGAVFWMSLFVSRKQKSCQQQPVPLPL